ncbi:MAG TPA: hypothetical protein VF691_14190 [Cytophagaceae bacterium]|jgi:hypothetical protein
MKGLKRGTTLELSDGAFITVEKVSIEKQEITFTQVGGESKEITLSLQDFINLLHPSSKPDNGYTIGKGMMFSDTDSASAEVIEVKGESIEYKKRWGSEVWMNTMTISDFESHFEKGNIAIF